jgi:hypothetical protein
MELDCDNYHYLVVAAVRENLVVSKKKAARSSGKM